MLVRMFNFWYFFFILLSAGTCVGLYFLLRNRTDKTKKIVLFSILCSGLLLHFLKATFPPYSNHPEILTRDIWFVNICGANIFFFPFFFLSKNEKLKDYMFYIGIIGGVLAILIPTEPTAKEYPWMETLDVLRYYYHHTMLFTVPLLMVLLKLHKLNYRRIWFTPIMLFITLGFIIVNQFIQSEIGCAPWRMPDFFNINYKNTSYIYGPGNDAFAVVFTALCPKVFKIVPVGEYAGQEKYWPLIWLIVPICILVLPISFGMCMIFDHKRFVEDMKWLFNKIKNLFKKKTPDTTGAE